MPILGNVVNKRRGQYVEQENWGWALASSELFVKFSKESADDCHFFLLCDWRDFPGGWLKVPEPWVVDSCWESEWSRKGVNLPTPHSELSTTPLVIMSTKRILTSYIQYTVQYSGDLTVPFPRYWGRGGEDGKSSHNPGLK
jgi:hypothetical protein